MRISDWSSDVCSSDLRDRKRKDIMVESIGQARTSGLNGVKLREAGKGQAGSSIGLDGTAPKIGNAQSPASRMAAEGAPVDMDRVAELKAAIAKHGRASGRARRCQYV